jgi:hypothetical protein
MKTEQNEWLEAEIKKAMDKAMTDIQSALKQTDKPKFEVGKVYHNKEWLVYITGINSYSSIECYGFNDGKWVNKRSLGTHCLSAATTEEWKQALENEARKKYKKGDVVKSLVSFNSVEALTFEEVSFLFNDLWIRAGNKNIKVFSQGQWAEVVEDKIMVGKWEVVLNEHYAEINGRGFNLIQLQKIADCLELTHGSILIDGEELTLDTCQKIINRLNK